MNCEYEVRKVIKELSSIIYRLYNYGIDTIELSIDKELGIIEVEAYEYCYILKIPPSCATLLINVIKHHGIVVT